MSFTVYKSSAGSGKTFTLVKEYLNIVLCAPDKYKRILAITFTNKAASEMKERIMKELKYFSKYPFDTNSNSFRTMLPLLRKETQLSDTIIAQRASEALSLILHNYSDFAISTIDSFVHRIIRSFSHDLKIPMNFEVEMDTERLLTDAIAILISKAGSDEKLTNALVEFTETLTDEEKNWNIEYDIFKYSKLLLKENTEQFIGMLSQTTLEDFMNIQKKLQKITTQYKSEITGLAKKGNELLKSSGCADEVFYYGNKGIASYFRKIITNPENNPKPNSYVINTIDNDKWTSAKATQKDIAAINNVKEKINECYFEINTYTEANFAAFKLYSLINRNIYPIAVLNEISKIIEDIKHEEGILPISEFNKKISEIILSQPVPFVYERVGEKYHHFMIDEFQDTSTLQWTNLLPLIENALANGNFNMIVGDGKQAIYRWRNGDVEQFAALPNLTDKITDSYSKERAESLKRNYQERFLSSNFRSLPDIIKFNNDFFSFIRNKISGDLQKIYDNCTQDYDNSKSGGFVSIDLFDSKKQEQTYDDITFNRIKDIIGEVCSDGFDKCDIAILCRSNSNADKIAQYLILNDIEVVSDESLLINNSGKVRFIIALYKFLENESDHIAALEIIHFLSGHEWFGNTPLQELIQEYNQGTSLQNLFKKFGHVLNADYLKSLSLYDLTEHIASMFLQDTITDPYVLFMLEAVKEYTVKQGSSINGFLTWWDNNSEKRSIIFPGNKHAVRIMTIHKSKGLEFPVVIYPFATENSKISETSVWVDKGYEKIEELPVALINNTKEVLETLHSELYESESSKSVLDMVNVMYVAFTRASERLYLISKVRAASETASVSGFLNEYIKSKNIWNEEQTTYTFGNPIKKQGIESKNEPPETIKGYTIKPANNRHHIRQRTNSKWNPEHPSSYASRGNIVHYLLSQIKDVNDVAKETEKLIIKSIINNEDANLIKIDLEKILKHPDISRFFTKDTVYKSEAELILETGHTLRPDRIIFENDTVFIIDYKTGKKSEEHISQLNEYGEELKKMGYSIGEKFLVYIDEQTVVKI